MRINIEIDSNTDSPKLLLAIAQLLGEAAGMFEEEPTVAEVLAGEPCIPESLKVETFKHTPLPVDVTSSADLPHVDIHELDSAGLPWDIRIHSSTQNRNADGTWRLKRNLNTALRMEVEAELRKNPASAVVEYPLPIEKAELPPIPVGGVVAPPVPSMPPPPPVEPTSSGITIPVLLQKIVMAINSGRLKPETVSQKLAELGIDPPEIHMIPQRAVLKEAIYGSLAQYLEG